MVRTTLNILANLLDSRLRPTIVQKVRRRILGMIHEREPGAAAWASALAADHAPFCRGIDPLLWEEATKYATDFRKEAKERLAGMPALGGGGNYHLLYFLVRLLRPEVVLETGVAAGYSTHAILTALEKNGRGHLYSSEFPYFRYPDPERYVGILVPEELKRRWTLALDGDSVSVPRFIERLSSGIDLFHYDSDKSYAGRRETFARVLPRLARSAVVLVDDIQDNFHFRDLIAEGGFESRVFGFEGKYCGLLERTGGALLSRIRDAG
jgi:predicted O-methyltransferase YrrM